MCFPSSVEPEKTIVEVNRKLGVRQIWASLVVFLRAGSTPILMKKTINALRRLALPGP